MVNVSTNKCVGIVFVDLILVHFCNRINTNTTVLWHFQFLHPRNRFVIHMGGPSPPPYTFSANIETKDYPKVHRFI